jgi:hypothetical protein
MGDFIPFKESKKLKEIGFDFPVVAYYDKWERLNISDDSFCFNSKSTGISAPDIHQVLKWLRNEKKIFINVDVRTNLEWYYEVWNINEKLSVLGNVPFNKSESYEEAAIAGVEYVIDNLI